MKAFVQGALILSFLAAAGSAIAQAAKEAGEPLSELPKRVHFAKGKLSIFTDFEERDGESVKIFIVNDTNEEINLSTQDGDLYLKQEAKVDGKWVRSQPHIYSWCGNSYFPRPALPPKQFFTRSTERMNPGRFDFDKAPAPVADPSELLPVRYRFYTKAHFEIISNEGEMPVSMAAVERARFDTMALNFGSLEKLVSVATGAVEVEGLDHMDPKQTAIGQLSRFPGDPVAQEALLKVLAEQLKRDAGDDQPEKNRLRDGIEGSLDVVARIFEPDEALKIHLEVIEDPSSSHREIALGCLSRGIKDREVQTNAIFDSFLDDYRDPLFLVALRLRSLTWESREERTSKFKAFIEDPDCPEEIQRQAKRLYFAMCPNRFLRLRTNFSSGTGLPDVSIENVSSEPIHLEYTHLYDLITSELELGMGGEPVPLRDDFSGVIDSERHEAKTRTLQPGEKITFEEVNFWRYHQLPDWMPPSFGFRIVTNLPQFGEVPSGGGTTFLLTMRHLDNEKFYKAALEEQRQ